MPPKGPAKAPAAGATKKQPMVDQNKFGHELDPLPPPARMSSEFDLDSARIETVASRRALEQYARCTVEADTREVGHVADETAMAAAALLLTGGATAATYAWNDRYQQLLQTDLGAWQGRQAWDDLRKLQAEFQMVAARECESAFVTYRTSRNRTSANGAFLRHVWSSYSAAHMYIRGMQNLSQTVFEQNITGVHTPLTALITIAGEFVTCTALPPLRVAQPAVLPTHGSVLRHALERVEAAMVLPRSQQLTMFRGADGRMYCLDAVNAAVVAAGPQACYFGDIARPVLSLKGLRNALLHPAIDEETGETLGPGKHALHLGCKAVASTLVDTVEVQLARARRDGKEAPTDAALFESGIVRRALRKHGVPVALLYGVLTHLDELLRLVKEHPELAKASRDMKSELDEQMEKIKLQDLRERRRLEAEAGIRNRRRKGDQGPTLDTRMPQVADYETVRLNPVAPVVRPPAATPTESTERPQAPSGLTPSKSVHFDDTGAKTPPPLHPVTSAVVAKPSVRKEPPKRQPSVRQGPAKRVAAASFLSGKPQPQEDADTLLSTEDSDAASLRQEQTPPPEPVTPTPQNASPSPAAPVPATAASTGAVSPEPHHQLRGVARFREIMRLAKLDGRWQQYVTQQRNARGAKALPPRPVIPKSAFAQVVAKAMRQQRTTLQQERQKRKQEQEEAARRQAELDALNAQRAGGRKKAPPSPPPPKKVSTVVVPSQAKLDVAAATELHPTINVEAVLLCRSCIVAEMALRSFKALLRSELVAPEHNTERILTQLRELRVQYVNRLTQSVYRLESAGWTSILVVMRAKFSAPDSFTPTFTAPITKYVLKHGPSLIGAVYDASQGRIVRLKALALRTTAMSMPAPVKLVHDTDNLNAAAAQISAEWEASNFIACPPAHGLAQQCVQVRCAVSSFLIEIAFAKNVADDLLQRALARASEDPFSVIFASGVASAVHQYEANSPALNAISNRHMEAVSGLALEQDLPFRAERERQVAATLQGMGQRRAATAMLHDSYSSALQTEPHTEPALSSVHIQRLLALNALSFGTKLYTTSRESCLAAVELAPISHPSKIFIAKLSRQLLSMPVTADTDDDLEHLLAVADASRSFHNAQFGVDSTEAHAATNVYFYILHQLKGDQAVDQELKTQIILTLDEEDDEQHETGDTSAVGHDDWTDDDLSNDDGDEAPAQGQGFAAQPSVIVRPGADDDGDGAAGGLTSPADEPVGDDPAGAPKKQAMIALPLAPDREPKRKKKKKKPQKPAQAAAAGGTTDGADTGGKPAGTLGQLQNRIVAQTNFVRERTRLLLDQMAERRDFWEYFCASYLDVAEAELEARKQILIQCEEEQRLAVVIASEQLAARGLCAGLETLFRRFHFTWAEQRDRIELMAQATFERTVLYQRDDIRRIHVREEYTHRVSLVRHQHYLRRVFLLPQLEHLNHVALFRWEARQFRAIVVEARATALIRWDREERIVRQRWIVGSEASARRTLMGQCERSVRSALERKELQERDSLRQLMMFVRLEYALRGTEFEEQVKREQIVAAFNEDRRQLTADQHVHLANRTLLLNELQDFEPLARYWLEVNVFFRSLQTDVLPALETVERLRIAEEAAEETVFLVEAEEWHVRPMIEHVEHNTFSAILHDFKLGRRAIMSTPAMQRIEQAEAQSRFVIEVQQYSGVALELTSEQERLNREHILTEQQRDADDIVQELRDCIEMSLAFLRSEFDRLQHLFRSMHVTDEALEWEEIVLASEADHRWRIERERSRFIAATLTDAEAAARLEIAGDFQTMYMDIIATFAPFAVAAGAFHEEVLIRRAASLLGQLEVWERLAVVALEEQEFCALALSAGEASARNALWATERRLRLGFVARDALAQGAIHRRASSLVRERMMRAALTFRECAAWLRTEPQRRHMLVVWEAQARQRITDDMLTGVRDFYAAASSGFDAFEADSREFITRSEQNERLTLCAVIVQRQQFFGRESIARVDHVALDELQHRECIRRLCVEDNLAQDHAFMLRKAKRDWYLALDQFDTIEMERRSRYWWLVEESKARDLLAATAQLQVDLLSARQSLVDAEAVAREALKTEERRRARNVAFAREDLEHELALEGAYRDMIRDREDDAFFDIVEAEETSCRASIVRDWAAVMVFDIILPAHTLNEEWARERAEPSWFVMYETAQRGVLAGEERRAREDHYRNASSIVNASIRRFTRDVVVREQAFRAAATEDEHLEAENLMRQHIVGCELQGRAAEMLFEHGAIAPLFLNAHQQLLRRLWLTTFGYGDYAQRVVLHEEAEARRRIFVEQAATFKAVVARMPAVLMASFVDTFYQTAARRVVEATWANETATVLVSAHEARCVALTNSCELDRVRALEEPQARRAIYMGYVLECKSLLFALGLHAVFGTRSARQDLLAGQETKHRQLVHRDHARSLQLVEQEAAQSHALASILEKVIVKRALWERVALRRFEAMGRLSLEASSVQPMEHARRGIIESMSIEGGYLIFRAATAELEHRRRCTIVKACEQSVRRRIVNEAGRSLAPHRLLFFEPIARHAIVQAEADEWALLTADSTCWAEYKHGASCVMVEQVCELMFLLEDVERDRRALLEAACLRESALGLSGVWYGAYGMTARQLIEAEERNQRHAVYTLYGVPTKELEARREVVEEESRRRDALRRQEVSWREVVSRWDTLADDGGLDTNAYDDELTSAGLLAERSAVAAARRRSTTATGAFDRSPSPPRERDRRVQISPDPDDMAADEDRPLNMAMSHDSARRPLPRSSGGSRPERSKSTVASAAPVATTSATPEPRRQAKSAQLPSVSESSGPGPRLTRTQQLRAEALVVRRADAERRAAEHAAVREDDLPLTHAQLRNFTENLRNQEASRPAEIGKKARKPPHRLPASTTSPP